MNYIFLDIDGPLLPQKMLMFHQNRKTGMANHPQFDEFAVRAFNLWVRYGNAKVIFSTSWAYSYTGEQLKDIMRHNGMGLDYHQELFTPKKLTSYRNHEILWWLADNAQAGDKFIAVDDDTNCQDIKTALDDYPDRYKADGRWIPVDYDNGLSWDNFIDGCDTLDINMDRLYQDEFGIKPLSDAEKMRRGILYGQ